MTAMSRVRFAVRLEDRIDQTRLLRQVPVVAKPHRDSAAEV